MIDHLKYLLRGIYNNLGGKLKNVLVCKCLKCGHSALGKLGAAYAGVLRSEATHVKSAANSPAPPAADSKKRKAFSFLAGAGKSNGSSSSSGASGVSTSLSGFTSFASNMLLGRYVSS